MNNIIFEIMQLNRSLKASMPKKHILVDIFIYLYISYINFLLSIPPSFSLRLKTVF